MKKIENLLFLPVLALCFYGASKYSSTTLDIHFQDTYFVIYNATIVGWSLAWLLGVIVLFKVIRQRQQTINIKFAIPYIVLTLLLFLVLWLPSGAETGDNGISDEQLSRWLLYNQLRMVAAILFAMAQVTFLIYFIVQLMKRPRLSGS